MKKILLYFSVLFIFSCSKGELPDSNYAGIFDPEVSYNLLVDRTRLNTTPYVPGSYSHDPQANNHPGYGFNVAGWVNLEYQEKNKMGKTYVLGAGMIEREILAGTEVTISPTTAEGFEFHERSNGVTENPIIFKMNSDIDITAVFKTIGD
ncbi:MAG: hypothetical protein GWO78_05440 [Dehalococcoidales bacterium]|nr:hypothetical protein [Dehalococcoidales bacterium]